MTWEKELEVIANEVEQLEAIALEEVAVLGCYDAPDEYPVEGGYEAVWAADVAEMLTHHRGIVS